MPNCPDDVAPAMSPPAQGAHFTADGKAEQLYPLGAATQFATEQLQFAECSHSARRVLAARNQLGTLMAHPELEFILRQDPAVAAELDAAKQAAIADERANRPSYRFPD